MVDEPKTWLARPPGFLDNVKSGRFRPDRNDDELCLCNHRHCPMSRNGGRPTRRSTGTRVTSTAKTAFGGSVLWWGSFLNNSGYGKEARGFLRGLTHRGVRVAARSTGNESSSYVELLKDNPRLAISLHDSLNRTAGPRPVTAVVHTPGDVLRRVSDADFTVGRTMFETDSLPDDWVRRINMLDDVWVPSTFNVETFRSAGVTIPIGVVPSGVDGSAYRPGLKSLSIPGARGCVFLAIFEWSHRKAPDVLLRAWAEAFRPDDEVSLVLRSYARGRFDGDSSATVQRLLDHELSDIGLTRADVAPIVVLGQQLSASAMPRLMSSADVFVGASRGEGWGRPLLEAMACGLPTIGTRWGGNLDFMDDSNSLLVEVEGLVSVDERMDIPFYRGHRWAEPSAGHLAELLRVAASDSTMRRSIGKRARSDIERRWQWQQVSAIAESRLKLRSSSNRGRSLPSTETAVTIQWRGDILADHSLATVNRELVKRIVLSPDIQVDAITSEVPEHTEYLPDLVHVGGLGRPLSNGPASVEVRHAWPPDLSSPRGARLVVIQPWEYGGIPQAWIEPMSSHIDETWVYSKWLKECYVRSGVPADKIALVPLGVDVATFSPTGPTFPLSLHRAVRFLFVGGTIARKGFDVLLDTYLSTFTPDDDVSLVVKSFGSDSVYRDSSMDDRVRAAMADQRNPAIELVDQRLSRWEMTMLYRSCDVLVHPYRGEGFGLPIAEAMACGLPALVTGYGASLDFCDETTGWLIPAREIPLQLPDMQPGPAGFWWAEPDAGALGRLMVHAAASAEERASCGAKARQRIVERFTWDQAATEASRRLQMLSPLQKTSRPAA